MMVQFRYSFLSLCLCGFIPFLQSLAAAQNKKDDQKDKPAVKLALPLAVAAGATTKVTIRGVKLDEASEVKANADKTQVKLLGKGKAVVPSMVDAGAVGETQVEIELTLAEEMAPGDLTLTVVTPVGSAPVVLPVIAKKTLIEAKEPNEGFAQAQPIAEEKLLVGVIEKPKDVDVFRVHVQAGQKLIAEVHAARQGSPLDAVVTVYNDRGQIVAGNDDQKGSRDSRLEYAVSTGGTYYLSLVDAHDLGSSLHAYRLTLRVE